MILPPLPTLPSVKEQTKSVSDQVPTYQVFLASSLSASVSLTLQHSLSPPCPPPAQTCPGMAPPLHIRTPGKKHRPRYTLLFELSFCLLVRTTTAARVVPQRPRPPGHLFNTLLAPMPRAVLARAQAAATASGPCGGERLLIPREAADLWAGHVPHAARTRARPSRPRFVRFGGECGGFTHVAAGGVRSAFTGRPLSLGGLCGCMGFPILRRS